MARQIGHTVNFYTGLINPALYVAGQGLVSAAEPAGGIEVNGHSLGGYLATAITRLPGAQAHVTQTTTFNSAGFALGSETAFTALTRAIGPGYGLGRWPSSTEQTNYCAKNVINVTTNSLWFSQIGRRAQLFNEEDITQLGNHYMYKLTDSLALATALERLDNSMSIDRASAFLQAGASRTAASLEGVLDGLSNLIQGAGQAPTSTGDASDSAASRVKFPTNLQALTDDANFIALQGKVLIETSGRDLASRARNDFGALAALLILSPVWIRGNGLDDGPVNALWSSGKWSAQQSVWQADRSMSPEDIAAGKQTYTDAYLSDRAAIRAAPMEANLRDVPWQTNGGQITGAAGYQPIVYSDSSSGVTFTVSASGAILVPGLPGISFGSDATDTLAGMSGNDRLQWIQPAPRRSATLIRN